MSRLREAWTRLEEEGRAAVIPYLTAGHPTLEDAVPLILAAAEGGADVIELGVPFSDPVADGPTIQASTQVALENGAGLAWCLDQVATARRQGVAVPIVLMGYCNPFLAYRLDRLARDAAEAGVDGFIVPDLPVEEAGVWSRALRRRRLDLIFLVAPTTEPERLRWILSQASGFVYCVARLGVTGRATTISEELESFLERARSLSPLPLAVGFGISEPDQVRRIAAIADGAIVGSSVIARIEESAPAQHVAATRSYVASLVAASRR